MSFKFYIPVLLWALVILVIIAIPGNYIPKPSGLWESISPDKILHFGLFAPLSYLLAWGIYKNNKPSKQVIIIPLIFGIIYAILTEMLQYYIIQGRNGNLFDAIADIIGVSLGLILFSKIKNSNV